MFNPWLTLFILFLIQRRRVQKLFFLRLAKSRTIAQKLVERGQVRIDRARVMHPHSLVQPGQVLTFAAHNSVRVLRIDRLPERRGPAAEAQSCYSEIAAPQPIDVRVSKP